MSFWSLDEVVGDLWNHVCLSIRPPITQFLIIRSLLFSETLQLVRACKSDKNVTSAFLENTGFADFGQKLAKIGLFGQIFPKI